MLRRRGRSCVRLARLGDRWLERARLALRVRDPAIAPMVAGDRTFQRASEDRQTHFGLNQ